MELLLYHFCPDTLNLYGDKGNIICLKKRCEWRGIFFELKKSKILKMQKHLVVICS